MDYKRYAEELAVVIHDIICASIIECKYPSLYKHALVSPVPKVETDFRQVSVLPVLGKVLEKVQILLNKDAFKVKENQQAFSHGRSTVSTLSSTSHKPGSIIRTTTQRVEKRSIPSY